MPALSPNTTFSRNPNCSWSSLGTEVLVLDMVTRRSHRLTGAAAVIWQAAVVDRLSFEAVVERVCESFEVERSVAERDANTALSELVGLGVLVAGV
jgi:hypothetical protein